MKKQNRAISFGDDSKLPSHKVKLMCSYGGKIQPRPHDHHLTYDGGDTKILAVDRRVTFSDILAKLNSFSGAAPDDDVVSFSDILAKLTSFSGAAPDDDVVSFKYQLPGKDLEALVSVINNDDDLEHMMPEYDRVCDCILPKPARLWIFLLYELNRILQKTLASVAGVERLSLFRREREREQSRVRLGGRQRSHFT